MVGLELAKHWAAAPRESLVFLGSGPVPPCAEHAQARYVRVAAEPEGLVDLSELAYARFCRRFESETTDWMLGSGLDPRETSVVVNDISEGPDLARLSEAGFAIVSIWHVDVVDYFNKLYLKNLVRPERLTRAYERSRALGAAAALPDLLNLVFEKQRQTVARSRRMIFPSSQMAETIERCYGGLIAPAAELRRRSLVVPWGVFGPGPDAAAAEKAAAELRAHYQLSSEDRVVMTLSRISPEKGLHLLLEAVRRLEQKGRVDKLCLMICGEAAFMMGQAYMRKVRRAAEALKRARVFFPGYLSAREKPGYFRLAELFVSPSIHESYGLNVVEAMRAGLPILASDHYGVRDVLRPEYGAAVSYQDLSAAPDALGAALGDLLADRGQLRAMGKRAAQAAAAMPFSRAAERVLDEALAGLAQVEGVKT